MKIGPLTRLEALLGSLVEWILTLPGNEQTHVCVPEGCEGSGQALPSRLDPATVANRTVITFGSRVEHRSRRVRRSIYPNATRRGRVRNPRRMRYRADFADTVAEWT